MHLQTLHALPTTLLLLTPSTIQAAPVPIPGSNGMHCGTSAISFLSPRYQSALGLRQYCSSIRWRGGEYAKLSSSSEDTAEMEKRELLYGPPNELIPLELLEAQSNKLKHLDVDLELDLALLRQTLRRRKHRHSGESKSLSLKATREHLVELGDYTWRDFQRGTSTLFRGIDSNILLAGASCVVFVVLALLGAEMVVARRKLSQQRRRQRVMKRVVRRGTKVRVRKYPFSLATITEESQHKQLLSLNPSASWDEKQAAVASLTPTC